MGTCMYCKKMIYLEWIAERGYHRECHERYLASRPKILSPAERAAAEARDLREQEKHRARRARSRAAKKAMA